MEEDTARGFVLWVVALLLQSTESERSIHQVLEAFNRLVEREWTVLRNSSELGEWHQALDQAKALLNDPSKLEQVQREFNELDLPVQAQKARTLLRTTLTAYQDQWKPVVGQFSQVLLDAKQSLEESPNALRVLEFVRTHTVLMLFTQIVEELCRRFELERAIPKTYEHEKQAWFALVSFKSSVSAFELYEKSSAQDDKAALALAMIATSVDFSTIKCAIQARLSAPATSDGGIGRWFAEFYERNQAKLEQRKQALVDLFYEFTRQEVTNLVQFKQFVVSAVNRWVSQWPLPAIAGNKDGVAYSCTGMRLSSFHIPPDKVKLELVSPTVKMLERGDPVATLQLGDVGTKITGLHYLVKQEYFPYLSAEGEAECDIQNIEAKCEVQVVKDDNQVLQLRLRVCAIQIGRVQIEFVQSKELWLMNLVKEMMAKQLQTYLQALLQDELFLIVQSWLERINAMFAYHVNPVLQSTLNVDVSVVPTFERALGMDANPFARRADLYSVKLETLDQLVLVSSSGGDGGEVVVVGVCAPDSEGKLKRGDRIVGINGMDITTLPVGRVKTRLRRVKRPWTLTFCPFQPAHVAGTAGEEEHVNIRTFTFQEDKLCIVIQRRKQGEKDAGAEVTGFRPLPNNGGKGPAELAGVPLGWILCKVNGMNMLSHTFDETLDLFATLAFRPVELAFCRNPDVHVELAEPVEGLNLVELPGGVAVVVSGFSLLGCAAADQLQGLVSGDEVIRIGNRSTLGMPFDQVVGLLKQIIAPITTSTGSKEIWFKSFQGFESPLQRQGVVKPGYQLVMVNGTKVESQSQAKRLVEQPDTLPLRLEFRNREAYEAAGW
ncbi:hypothetical protein BASA81_006559 [Batrachochytrium salamandrivorans]|nr:hypothetical protein BASA81_006559 [Batrachochytrium salamandrivorans]